MATIIVVTGTRGIPDVQGGVETHIENLFPLIVEAGYEVHICCRACYIPVEKRIAEYKGCKLVYIDTPRKRSLEAIVHTWKSILYAKRINADIIHIHAIGPALLVPFAKLLGLKVVFTHHGPDYERKKWGKFARFMLRKGESAGCNYSDRIIAISDVIRTDVSNRYARSDTSLIHNGVVLPKPMDDTSFLYKLGLQKKRYVLSVARFVEEKGLHDLIEAFIRTSPKEWNLVIAGDADHETEYSRKLKKIAASDSRIVLTGFIKGAKLSQIYWNAGLFVLPSYHEGLPIALLEAMSYNLPVLVSDIPPHLEMCLKPENYFPMGNASMLFEAISQSMNVTPVTLDYSSVMNTKYNWDTIAAQTAKIYKFIGDNRAHTADLNN